MAVDIRRFPIQPLDTRAQAAKLEDPAEIRRLLTLASEAASKVDVFFPEAQLRWVTRVTGEWAPGKKFCFDVPAGAKIEIPPHGECKAIVFLKGHVLLCIRSESASFEEGLIVLQEPLNLFRLQRRKEPRYDIPLGYEHWVTIQAIEGPARRVQKRLLDVSASGLSIQVPSSREAGLFRKGLILARISFRVDDRLVTVDAQVCNSVPLPKTAGLAGFKIGLKILRISREDRAALYAWVARELAFTYPG